MFREAGAAHKIRLVILHKERLFLCGIETDALLLLLITAFLHVLGGLNKNQRPPDCHDSSISTACSSSSGYLVGKW